MQRLNTFSSSTGLRLFALAFTLALPSCDEPIEEQDEVDQAAVDQDEDDADGRTGQIRLEDGAEVTYVVENGKAILDGDILLGDADAIESRFRSAGSTVHNWGGIWHGGVVYYQIQPGYQAAGLVPAIQHWEALTGIQFVNAANPTGYVQIGDFGGCFADVGHRPNAVSTLSMQAHCDNVVMWIHEIGHTVGLHHEQSRSDRDNHVNILWHNIMPHAHHNFQKYVEQGYAGYDLGPYDTTSVMHYHSWSYTLDPNNWYMMAITHKDGSQIPWAPHNGLSPGDVQGVGAMYGVW